MRTVWKEARNVGVGIVAVFTVSAGATGSLVESPAQVEAIIKQEAIKHGLDHTLLLAIARTESGLNPRAKGKLNEIGLFQLRPEMHACASFDARKNTRCAIKYLLQLRRHRSDYGDAWWVAYNYGPNRKLKYPRLFPYYKRVMAARD